MRLKCSVMPIPRWMSMEGRHFQGVVRLKRQLAPSVALFFIRATRPGDLGGFDLLKACIFSLQRAKSPAQLGFSKST